MIIWSTLNVKNSSNTLTITPTTLSTDANNGFTIDDATTVNGTLTCNQIRDTGSDTYTSKLRNLTIDNQLKFTNSDNIKAGTVTYPGGNNAWSESNVISYKNCDIGQRIGIKHLPNNAHHWYLEIGPEIWGGTAGDAVFQRLRFYSNSDATPSTGIAFFMGREADPLGDLEIRRWDSSDFAGFKASTIVASTKVEAPIFNSTSDRRLKTNVQPWQSQCSILDLPIYSFDYIADNSHHIGCLAQDLQLICPELVNEGVDGYLHIEESKLVYLLIQEVKELKQQVQQLMGK